MEGTSEKEQQDVLKEYYDENDDQEDPRMVKALWVGRVGIPIIVITFTIVYWIVGITSFYIG